MNNVNVLILSAGRRVELVNCFKKALNDYEISGKVITADASNTAPAMYYGDVRYKVPRIDSGEYIKSIIEICNKEKVDLVIPTIDTELLLLSENKKQIESTGAKVLISNNDVISICRDKRNTNKFFEEHGFGVAKELTAEEIRNGSYQFPLFIKPFNGSSSINTFKVNNEKELEFFRDYVKEPIIQEFIEGKEYTIDVFLDFDSNPITIVPRERLATRSGEISKGLIVKDREIIDEIKKVVEVLKPIGHITVQCMKTNDGIKFIEINPRFGGGAPMTIKAGANSPLNLYKLLRGEHLSYNEEYMENILSLRYDSAIFITEKGEVIGD